MTNFANGDVIGHTSNDHAKVEAAKQVSLNLARVIEEAKKQDYVIAVTADHGNIEVLRTVKGTPHVAHTDNLVSFILIDPRDNTSISMDNGALCDVATTILHIMNIPKPKEMTGNVLIHGHDFGKERKVLLIVCDGWGQGDKTENDAIYMAETPYWDQLLRTYSRSSLEASGML